MVIRALLLRSWRSYAAFKTFLRSSRLGRARGGHGPDSDLDLAVVLNGPRGDFIDTKLDMVGLAFDVLLQTGLLVQAFPMGDGDLPHPERFPNPALMRTIARQGLRLA